ncbi:hypothetical protein KDU71_06675 [Carboxylicivirga sediminis]|uniref:Uncharacterized protein n=1 Tax=Carboxylicivirga sediminis TaxID=2006564 RepID=A0A941F2L6_9BACT|nr:hypothetical protein [Carboxylicivirga sediminis]MBR8535237.1 hypothetical protein [Carboxylicivirga sediminis]
MLPDDVWELISNSYKYERRRCRKQFEEVCSRSSYRMIDYRNADVLKGFIGFWDFGKWVVIEHLAVSNNQVFHETMSMLLKQLIEQVDKNVIIVAEVDILLAPEHYLLKSEYVNAGFVENPYVYIQPSYHRGCASYPQRIMSFPHSISYEQFKDLRSLLYRFIYGKN